MTRRLLAPLVVLSLAALCACARQPTGPVSYPRSSTATALQVFTGRVVSVQPVEIEGEYGIVGTVGGAAVGHAVGRTIGDGSGRRVAGAVGGVAGAVAGRAVEKSLTRKAGLEIIVELDDGRSVAVVQEPDEMFRVGDRVRLLRGRGSARVRHI